MNTEYRDPMIIRQEISELDRVSDDTRKYLESHPGDQVVEFLLEQDRVRKKRLIQELTVSCEHYSQNTEDLPEYIALGGVFGVSQLSGLTRFEMGNEENEEKKVQTLVRAYKSAKNNVNLNSTEVWPMLEYHEAVA